MDARKIAVARRWVASFRSILGHDGRQAFNPAASRRWASQTPMGMRTRPATNSPGRIRKNSIPRYGLACMPASSSRKNARKRMAPVVVSAAPKIVMAFLNSEKRV